jgi:hypothetical protein
MMDLNLKIPGNFVVRRVVPMRNALLAGVCLFAGVLALYIIYELGRYDGGYDRLAAAQQRSELRVSIEKLDATNRQLRTQLAELDTLRVGRAQERAELARTIGELQSQVAHQSQELGFYRDLVAQSIGPREAGEGGLKIQQLHVTPVDRAGHFRVRIVLLQAAHPESAVSGTYGLTLEGQASGKAATLDFAALTDGRMHAQPFTFRYFANLEEDIAVPAGFRPQRLIVQVQSGHAQDAPISQTFPWSVDAP